MANTPPETAPVALARKERYPAAYESGGAGAPTTSRRHEPPGSGGERLKGGLRPGGWRAMSGDKGCLHLAASARRAVCGLAEVP